MADQEDSWPDNRFDVIDRDAYIALYAVCLAVAILVNAGAIVIVIYLVAKDRKLRAACFPKLVTVLFSCLVQLVLASYPMSAMLHRSGHSTPCSVAISAFVLFLILLTLSVVAVSVVILTEAMRLAKMGKGLQMGVTVALLVLATLYSFALVMFVLYFDVLADPENPCDSEGNVELELNTQLRILYALLYVIPAAAILISQILYVIAYVTGTPKSSVPIYDDVYPAADVTDTTSEAMDEDDDATPDYVNVADDGGHVTHSYVNVTCDGVSANIASVSGRTEMQAPARHDVEVTLKPPFALDAFVAGLITIILLFPHFYYNVVYLFNTLQTAMAPKGEEGWKFGTAIDFLILAYLIILPCCWVFGADIRAAVFRCVKQPTGRESWWLRFSNTISASF
ncbi:hypothetical protein BaRGS_00040478 [Batillaria attramentaria]|uniref:G-protein coupled receptors family 1 profile domain-containing protein n=1 Tax=Batillaria attramentaria TaxID=370345 RepID=A0ABD0J0I0_9CAEN